MTLSPKIRISMTLLLGVGFWILILHDLYSFRLGTILETEKLWLDPGRLPKYGATLLAFGGGVLACAFLVVVAVRKTTLPLALASLGVGVLIHVSYPEGPVPQEWSGIAALAVGSYLLALGLTNRIKILAVTAAVLVTGLLLLHLERRFDGKHRAKAQELGRLLAEAEKDLEHKQAFWSGIRPGELEEAARELGRAGGTIRLDERLDRMLALETTPAERSDILTRIDPLEFAPSERAGPEEKKGGNRRTLRMPDYRGGLPLRNRSPLGLDPSDLGAVLIRMRVTAGKRMRFFWSSGKTLEPLNGMELALAPPDEFGEYRLQGPFTDVGPLSSPERIDYLWIEPSDEDAEVQIESIILATPAGSVCLRAPVEVGVFRKGGQSRPVICARSPSQLAWDIDIPLGKTRLDLGMTVPSNGPGIRFEVSISARGATESVLAVDATGDDAWVDASVPLAAWAGEKVRISLEMSSERPGVGVWSSPTIRSRTGRPPNVILYVIDCLRADHLGAYGDGAANTPEFDALAARGTLFLNAYANGCHTKHSVPSLLTSNPATANGARHPYSRVLSTFPTMAGLLRSMGYVTAAFTTNGIAVPYSGTGRGFSHVFEPASYMPASSRPGTAKVRTEDVLGPVFEKWLDGQVEGGFFLYIHTMDAHGPYDPPMTAAERERVQEGSGRVTRNPALDPEWVAEPSIESRSTLYAGEVGYGDAQLGRLLRMLEGRGVLGRSLIVVTADHGEYLGEHGMWGHDPPPFRQGIHVPLLMAGPDIPAGLRIETAVQLMDLLPTLLEILGYPEYAHPLFQGRSLAPLLRGESAGRYSRAAIFTEGRRAGEAGMILGRYHLIPEKNLIFDLESDPDESKAWNEFWLDFPLKERGRRVARAHRDCYRSLYERLSRGAVDLQPLPIDAETRERLRALGYLE